MVERAQRSLRDDVGVFVLVVVAYFVTGRLGLTLASYNKVATLIWAPSGIAVAAVWLRGRWLALAVAASALITNLSIGVPVPLAIAIACGNAGEAVVADVLIERAGLRHGLRSVRDVVLFGGLVVGAATMVAAVNATFWLSVIPGVAPDHLLSTGFVWWLGDAGGVLVMTPLVLAFARPAVVRPANTSEGALIAVLAPGLASISFGLMFPGAPSSAAMMLLPFPILAWAAMRFGLRGATAATAIVAVAGVLGTAAHTGPFRSGSAFLDAAGLWSLLATLSVTSMFLAASLEERHLQEERRLAAERQLEGNKRLTELGLLAGGIAHDFNNLLMVVRANAALLRTGDARFTAEAIATIEESVVRAAELTDSLLAYAGRKPMQLREVDLGRLTAETVRMLGTSAPEGIAVSVEAVDDVPCVEGEPSQLRQILMNLLLNAFQGIAGEGSVKARVSLDRRSSPPRVVLEVCDTGTGMDEATIARVFQPFFTTKEHGRGLGMAAVSGIVTAHHGEIAIESRVGAGTTVRVSLPAVMNSRAEQPRRSYSVRSSPQAVASTSEPATES